MPPTPALASLALRKAQRAGRDLGPLSKRVVAVRGESRGGNSGGPGFDSTWHPSASLLAAFESSPAPTPSSRVLVPGLCLACEPRIRVWAAAKLPRCESGGDRKENSGMTNSLMYFEEFFDEQALVERLLDYFDCLLLPLFFLRHGLLTIWFLQQRSGWVKSWP